MYMAFGHVPLMLRIGITDLIEASTANRQIQRGPMSLSKVAVTNFRSQCYDF
jgi:hypothetical protein